MHTLDICLLLQAELKCGNEGAMPRANENVKVNYFSVTTLAGSKYEPMAATGASNQKFWSHAC